MKLHLPRLANTLLSVVGALCVMALSTVPASAHGTTIILADDDYGPYHVVVTTNNISNDPKLVWLTVVLSQKQAIDAADPPQPVLGATVKAIFSKSGTASSVMYDLPTEPVLADSGYYESELAIPEEGDWQVKLDISGPDGPASVEFPLPLHGAIQWMQIIQWAFAGALLIFAFVYLRSSFSSGKKEDVQQVPEAKA